MPRKSIPQATRRLFEATVSTLEKLLPSWSVEAISRRTADGTIRLTATDGTEVEVTVQARDRISPSDAVQLPEPDGPALVAASWLSPRTRSLLDDIGIGYVDQTGNVSLRIERPALIVRLEGAQRDPSPGPSKGLNLRGPKAWALMRTLVEVLPPYGVSDLAKAVDTDPGYASRLLGALGEELLVTRVPRGPVEYVEWEGLIRQLASTYSLMSGNDTTNWIASAGPDQFLHDLASSSVREWAVTGSFAASELVSVAAPEIAVVYADDPERVAALTRLRPVRNGGNVVLARPYDRIVFQRTWTRNDVTYASPTQLAIDCLTGPGRMPAEGEALITWLERKVPRWQAASLKTEPKLP